MSKRVFVESDGLIVLVELIELIVFVVLVALVGFVGLVKFVGLVFDGSKLNEDAGQKKELCC